MGGIISNQIDSLPPDRLNLQYRPDIDGLRAVAVASVVLFHAFPEWAKSGFIGVDVFFVISGFLITSIICSGLKKGTFSFSQFYSRRIIRIFPALAMVLLACLIFGWFALLSDEYSMLGRHVLSGATFISNLTLLSESGYFDVSAESKPLLHLWSLAIEEQFYIVWPLLLWFLWKLRGKIIGVLIAMVALSLFLSIKITTIDASEGFYSIQTRAWELLLGGVLGYASVCDWRGLRDRAEDFGFNNVLFRNAISYLGVVFLAVGFYLIDETHAFPGSLAAIPVFGTAFVIVAGRNAWINRKILSNRVLVWIGLISFPLYLWHWPLLSFARIIEGEDLELEVKIFVVVMSVVLAWISYRFVEKPIRKIRTERSHVGALLLIMLLLGYAGSLINGNGGYSFRVADFERISAAAGEWQYPGKLEPYQFGGKSFLFQKSGLEDVTLFIGDSNVEQYYARVDELIETDELNTNNVIFATGGGCFPVPDSVYDVPHQHCNGLMETALNMAAADEKIKNVVIGGQWNSYFSTGYGLKDKIEYGDENYKAALFRLSTYISQLKKHDKNVFLILNIPAGPAFDPKFMVQRKLTDFPKFFTIKSGGISRKEMNDKYGGIQHDLADHAEKAGAIIIDPLKHICSKSYCPSIDENGNPLYKDGYHLRPSYVRENAWFLDRTVRRSDG